MMGKVVGTSKNFAEVEIICDKSEGNFEKHCGACGHFVKKHNLPTRVIMKNNINAVIGDVVEYELEDMAKIKAAAMLLLMPLLVLLATAGIVSHLNMKIWLNLLISFSSLVITFILLKIVLKNKTYFYIRSKKGEIKQ